MIKEQGIIIFVGLPVLFFIAWLILTFIGYKRENDKYSLLNKLPYESFEGINPALSFSSRIIFILYVISLLPFFLYLFTFSLNYGSTLSSLSGVLVFVTLGIMFAMTFISYVKMSKAKTHFITFMIMAFLITAQDVLLANYFNTLRIVHLFGVTNDNALFAISMVFILVGFIEATLLINKKLLRWEFKERSEKGEKYYLAFAEWSTIIISLINIVIAAISFFLIA